MNQLWEIQTKVGSPSRARARPRDSSLDQRIEIFGATYGLSEREQQILRLLAAGTHQPARGGPIVPGARLPVLGQVHYPNSTPVPGIFLERANTGLYPIYRLSGPGVAYVDALFQRYGFDVRDIRIRFGETFGNDGVTVGNVITLDARTWNANAGLLGWQIRLLMHEIVHSVQYRDLGFIAFVGRYFSEYPSYGVVDYGSVTPQEVLEYVSITDSRYSLDQIADTISDAWARLHLQ